MARSTLAANFPQLRVDGMRLQLVERQREEELDAPAKDSRRVAECRALLLLRAFDGCRVLDAPVRGHGLARPYRTGLARRAVAHREDEIDRRRSRPCELIP